MTEDDADSVATDSQQSEETELPVIQLCGLVEELRYRPAAAPHRGLHPSGLGPGLQHRSHPIPH
jgi:hypothetical protein